MSHTVHAGGLSQRMCYKPIPPQDLDVHRLTAQDVHGFFMPSSNTNVEETDKVVLLGFCAWRQFVMEILSRCHVS